MYECWCVCMYAWEYLQECGSVIAKSSKTIVSINFIVIQFLPAWYTENKFARRQVSKVKFSFYFCSNSHTQSNLISDMNTYNKPTWLAVVNNYM